MLNSLTATRWVAKIVADIQESSFAEVVLVVIEGGGHTWPGRPPLPAQLGKSTMNIAANDWIWEFFQKHPLPRGPVL